MAKWGTELWDRYPSVHSHMTSGCDELVSVLAKYVRERSVVENEYAKNIRKLVTKYTSKVGERNKGTEEETSYARAFRLVLEETGFQAGQHEVLAESLGKLIHSNIQIKTSIINKATQDNLKEARNLTETFENHQQSLDKAKRKYQKSLAESSLAKRSYLKADGNPTVSRNEIAKLKHTHESLLARARTLKVLMPVSY